MPSGVDQPPAVHDEDAVAAHRGADTLRDDDLRPPLYLFAQPCAQTRLGHEVESGKAVVKDKDRGVFQYRAGDAYALLLPAGEILAGLLEHMLQPVGQSVHIVGHLRDADGLLYLRLARAGAAHLDIPADTAGIYRGALEHAAHIVADGLAVYRGGVAPIEVNLARRRQAEAHQQLHQSGFAAARAADDGDLFAGTDM